VFKISSALYLVVTRESIKTFFVSNVSAGSMTLASHGLSAPSVYERTSVLGHKNSQFDFAKNVQTSFHCVVSRQTCYHRRSTLHHCSELQHVFVVDSWSVMGLCTA
jgi:hypothetical protein